MKSVKRRPRLLAPSGGGAKPRRDNVADPNFDIYEAMRLRAGEAPVYPTFLGSIPPEETDEEFAAAVDAFS